MSFTLLANNHVEGGDLLSDWPRPLTSACGMTSGAAFLARTIQLLVLRIIWINDLRKIKPVLGCAP
jgi:hypothetical protein